MIVASEVSTERKSSRHPRGDRLRVLIFAASSLMRAGLESLLEAEESIEVSASVSSAAELASASANREPDVVVIQADNLNALSLRQEVGALKVPVVLLAKQIDADLIFDALSSGISGVLHADSSSRELASALHGAAVGLITLTNGAATLLAKSLRNRTPADQDEIFEELTAREHEVMEMMVEGLSNKEIAVQLNLSVHTVKFHISSILAKLGAASRTEATTIGLRRGLITI
jgi:NarL family two-component system response regulator YdfI